MTDIFYFLIVLFCVGGFLWAYFLIGKASYNVVKRSRPRRPLTAEEQLKPDAKAVKALREGRYRNSTTEKNWQGYDAWWRGKANTGGAPWHRTPSLPPRPRTGDDLAGARLHYSDFAGLQIVEAHLPEVNFKHSKLAKTNFQWSNLDRANFSAADLRGANFSSTSCDGADFSNSNLHGAKFDGASLRGTNFDGANLTGVDLSTCVSDFRTSFQNAELSQAKMPQREFPSQKSSRGRTSARGRRRRTKY